MFNALTLIIALSHLLISCIEMTASFSNDFNEKYETFDWIQRKWKRRQRVVSCSDIHLFLPGLIFVHYVTWRKNDRSGGISLSFKITDITDNDSEEKDSQRCAQVELKERLCLPLQWAQIVLLSNRPVVKSAPLLISSLSSSQSVWCTSSSQSEVGYEWVSLAFPSRLNLNALLLEEVEKIINISTRNRVTC